MQKQTVMATTLVFAMLTLVSSHAALLISYDMDGFTGPVSGSGTEALTNAGTYSSDNGTVLAFGDGSVTATNRPTLYKPVNTALAFHGTTGSTPDGGLIRFDAPAITGNYSFAYSVRRDGGQYAGAKVFDLAESGSMNGGSFIDSDTLRIAIAHKSTDIDRSG